VVAANLPDLTAGDFDYFRPDGFDRLPALSERPLASSTLLSMADLEGWNRAGLTVTKQLDAE